MKGGSSGGVVGESALVIDRRTLSVPLLGHNRFMAPQNPPPPKKKEKEKENRKRVTLTCVVKTLAKFSQG